VSLAVLFSQVSATYFPSLLVTSGEALVAVFAISLLLFALRWPFLRLRARSPRVQVANFAWAAPKSSDSNANALWVSSLVREELTALRLAPMEALPGASSGPPLVEIVESVGEGIGDKSRLGEAVGRLFRAVLPEAAYQVSGTLKPSDSGRGTIAVQVVDRARGNKTLVSAVLDDADWRDSARTAAATAAGALYPCVANRHKGAWSHWKKPVPSELIKIYDEARTHEKCDRLEQAMGAYHLALDRDPLNPNLRLRIAMLQERLELYLGAWVTYQAIADEPYRDTWKGPNRRVRLLALYRLAILLGNRRVAELWVDPSADPDEPKRRAELLDILTRDRLLNRTSRPKLKGPAWLARRFPALMKGSSMRLLDELRDAGDWTEEAEQKWIREQLEPAPGMDETAAVRQVGWVLEILGMARLEQLDARLRRKPPWRVWRWAEWCRYRLPLHRSLQRREFSLCAVRVSKLLARVRIAASAEQRSTEGDRDALERVKAQHLKLRQRWPFPATSPWRLPARWLRPRHRLADRRDDAWQYHYNAACTVVAALPNGSRPKLSSGPAEDAKLVKAALKQLEEYVHRAGSSQVREQANWVGGEDDDLTALRSTKEYTDWASHHLPRGRATQTRIDTARIAARIARGGARAFATSWRARAADGSARAELVATWWREETAAWRELGKIFDEHRSWHKRWEGIDALQACLRASGEPGLIDAAHRPEDRAAAEELSANLLELLTHLAPGNPALGPKAVPVRSWASRRAGEVRAAYEKGAGAIGQPGLRTEPERVEALRAFRIWNRLAEALEAELDGTGNRKAGRRIEECLTAIRDDLAQEANGSWRRPRQFISRVLLGWAKTPPDPSRR
jgi:tetratricopeptide (TPR) repeat protein